MLFWAIITITVSILALVHAFPSRGKYTSISHDNHQGKVIGNLAAREEFQGNFHPSKAGAAFRGCRWRWNFPVICSWEKFPHLSQERPKNRVDISPRTLPREEIVVGFSLDLCKWWGLGTILKNSTQEYGLQTHPVFGKGNFPKTLPREEIVVGFSPDLCRWWVLETILKSQKLYPRKCFTDPPRNWEGKFPKNSSQGRNSGWIFPDLCRWWESFSKTLPKEMFYRPTQELE